MDKMLEKLMAKKKDSPMSPEYKKTKMDVLKALHGEMGNMMKGDLEGLKKVTVAAPDADGLALGLDKAKDLVGDATGAEDMPEMIESEEDMLPLEESPEDIDAQIQALMAKKAAMKKV